MEDKLKIVQSAYLKGVNDLYEFEQMYHKVLDQLKVTFERLEPIIRSLNEQGKMDK